MAPLVRLDGRSIPHGCAVRKSFRPGYDRPMRATLIVLGLLLAASGLVWMAQGLNLPFAPGSFMTGDRSWIVIGAAAVLAGSVLVWRGRRPH